MIASIATEYSAGRLFDYTVPAVFVSTIKVGQRVRIPFHNRETIGYVMELDAEGGERRAESGGDFLPNQTISNQTIKQYTLKPILGIDDPVPFFTPTLIKLSRWMAGYLLEPVEKILRCVIPSPVRAADSKEKTQLYVSAVEVESGERSAEGISSPIKQSNNQTIKQSPPSLTSRQREVLENICRVGGAWLRAAPKEFGCSEALLRTLEQKGVVKIEPTVRRRDPLAHRKILPTKPMKLMSEQAKALASVIKAIDDPTGGKPILIRGVTGSGKTEIYLQAIDHALKQGKSAIVMVPEIALTAQTVQRFAARFGKIVAVLHSALGDGERYDEWHRIRSGEARVVVGPRSAIFAPTEKLGLIVVDEEHEPSYKQEDPPRYQGRDLAVMRAHLERCAVVLGTATPSLETWHNVQTGKYDEVVLTERVKGRPMPSVRIIDMRVEAAAHGGRVGMFSTDLLDALKLRLERGEQAMLFLNRRGWSHSLTCISCGHVEMCDDCSVAYTYHMADDCLRCHICGAWKRVPSACPECGDPDFRSSGFGTQRVEAALKKCFPSARVLRMDADVTARKHSHEEILSLFRGGRADILVGTQMIAKGLDFPNVTLVGVLSADASLHAPDFRASERTYQLLAQVSGRAGRAELPGEVLVQTFSPEHPAIQAAARDNGFVEFASGELADRRQGGYPPFARLTCITFKGKDEARLKTQAEAYGRLFEAAAKKLPKLRAGAALPAPLLKAKTWYRYQLLLLAPTQAMIAQAVKAVFKYRPLPPGLQVAVDVDAWNF